MLLVYTEKKSSRFDYIAKHIFDRMLGADFEVTTNLEEFIISDEAKISYAKQSIGDEFFIKNFGLLFQKGIDEIEIYMRFWDETPYFFASKNGDLPFDILSASFYLLSRYEEYLPHLKSEHNRYPAEESLAHKNQFLELPLIDIWVKRFRKLLVQKYPDLVFKEKGFRQLSVVEVSSTFAYKHRDILRTLIGFSSDFFSLNFSKITTRFLTLMGLRRDPYDNFDELITFHKENQIPSLFFFLLTELSVFDRGISPNVTAYRTLIKMIADYDAVSVLASYNACYDVPKLKAEREEMIEIINRPVKRIRMSYNRLIIPETYENITDAEYNEDYTMGYFSHPGFRASTCTPFYFYDINLEVQLPIRVNPFCFHSQHLEGVKNKKDALKIARSLKYQIENVNGKFITVFTNEKLGKDEKYRRFYKEILTLTSKN